MGTRATGHLSTVVAVAGRALFPATAPRSQPWSTTLDDPRAGPVVLNGPLSQPDGARDLVVLVHGLGGSSDSGYLKSAACAAHALGLASLRLNLRGADGGTGDFYHGGLTDDLHAVAASTELRRFERVFVLGFSMGGHIALRFATEVNEPRVAAVAAACSPLDLAAGADVFDTPRSVLYRNYILRQLKATYERIAILGSVPTPPEKMRTVRTIRQWDSLTVVPRFGFKDPDDYYSRASVGSRLERLRVPALLLATENDPIITPATIRPSLDGPDGRFGSTTSAADRLTVRWLSFGGHLGFARSVTSQILLWLLNDQVPRQRPRQSL